jgi:RFX DNA-binding domain
LKEGISVSDGPLEQNYCKYIQSSNPVRAFVEASLEKSSDSSESKDDVYKAFKMFCDAKNLPMESEQSFSRKLKKEYGFNDVQRRDDKGHKPYYWIGIKLKDWKPAEEGQSTL